MLTTFCISIVFFGRDSFFSFSHHVKKFATKNRAKTVIVSYQEKSHCIEHLFFSYRENCQVETIKPNVREWTTLESLNLYGPKTRNLAQLSKR